MQHFLFPPTGAPATSLASPLSQHESNSPIPSPPTLFIQIYSRFPPKFALARPMDRGSKDDRETGREEGGQTNEGLIQHETVAGCDSVEGHYDFPSAGKETLGAKHIG